MTTTTFRDPMQAFDEAIASGRLSTDKKAANFAGAYMYMGTQDGADLFKHVDSRRYLAPLAVGAVAMVAPAAAWAHDMHGLIHEHASGFLFLAVWLIVSAVLYFVDVRRAL